MIWATALLLPLARRVALPVRECERTHAHKWDGQQSISAAKSLSATLGAAALSCHPIPTDVDVAVKLVGKEKDLGTGSTNAQKI